MAIRRRKFFRSKKRTKLFDKRVLFLLLSVIGLGVALVASQLSTFLGGRAAVEGGPVEILREVTRPFGDQPAEIGKPIVVKLDLDLGSHSLTALNLTASVIGVAAEDLSFQLRQNGAYVTDVDLPRAESEYDVDPVTHERYDTTLTSVVSLEPNNTNVFDTQFSIIAPRGTDLSDAIGVVQSSSATHQAEVSFSKDEHHDRTFVSDQIQLAQGGNCIDIYRNGNQTRGNYFGTFCYKNAYIRAEVGDGAGISSFFTRVKAHYSGQNPVAAQLLSPIFNKYNFYPSASDDQKRNGPKVQRVHYFTLGSEPGVGVNLADFSNVEYTVQRIPDPTWNSTGPLYHNYCGASYESGEISSKKHIRFTETTRPEGGVSFPMEAGPGGCGFIAKDIPMRTGFISSWHEEPAFKMSYTTSGSSISILSELLEPNTALSVPPVLNPFWLGAISFVPTEAGTAQVLFDLTSSVATDAQTGQDVLGVIPPVSIEVIDPDNPPPPTPTPQPTPKVGDETGWAIQKQSALPAATVGEKYNQVAKVTREGSPVEGHNIHISLTSNGEFPPGLDQNCKVTYNPVTNKERAKCNIVGTPEKAGNYTLTINFIVYSLEDGSHQILQKDIALTVVPGEQPDDAQVGDSEWRVTEKSFSQPAQVGERYSALVRFSREGRPDDADKKVLVIGDLPAGLTQSCRFAYNMFVNRERAICKITGRPEAAGEYNPWAYFEVTRNGQKIVQLTKQYTLVVEP